jgi:hypothetical protein
MERALRGMTERARGERGSGKYDEVGDEGTNETSARKVSTKEAEEKGERTYRTPKATRAV